MTLPVDSPTQDNNKNHEQQETPSDKASTSTGTPVRTSTVQPPDGNTPLKTSYANTLAALLRPNVTTDPAHPTVMPTQDEKATTPATETTTSTANATAIYPQENVSGQRLILTQQDGTTQIRLA